MKGARLVRPLQHPRLHWRLYSKSTRCACDAPQGRALWWWWHPTHQPLKTTRSSKRGPWARAHSLRPSLLLCMQARKQLSWWPSLIALRGASPPVTRLLSVRARLSFAWGETSRGACGRRAHSEREVAARTLVDLRITR